MNVVFFNRYVMYHLNVILLFVLNVFIFSFPLFLFVSPDHRRVLAKLPGGLLCGSVAHSAPQLLPGHHTSHHGGRHRRAEHQWLLCVQPAGTW